jgi:hypothetical protein
MTLKTIVLAGVTALSLAAPAAALAQPYAGYDRGYHDAGNREGWRDRDDWRWRRHERWEHHDYAYGRRCFIENRGYYGWNGRYVSRRVEVCR